MLEDSPTNRRLLELIYATQQKTGITDREIGKSLGEDSDRVMQLLKYGLYRVTPNNLEPLSKTLGLPTRVVLRAIINDISPEVMALIEDTMDPLRVTEEELELIKEHREKKNNQRK